MTKIKAVIFDLDGTIGNTLPLCIKAFKQAIQPLIGRTVSDAEIVATFGPSEEGTIMALAPNQYQKGIDAYLKYYKDFHEMCPAPFDGVVELLEHLKSNNIRVAMVTGKGEHSTEISLQKFKIKSYFESVETGMASGPRKPQGILNIIDTFKNIARDEIIYVGDAPSDISACRQVKVPIIAAAWAETAEKEKLEALQPDKIFNSFTAFSNWLKTVIS